MSDSSGAATHQNPRERPAKLAMYAGWAFGGSMILGVAYVFYRVLAPQVGALNAAGLIAGALLFVFWVEYGMGGDSDG